MATQILIKKGLKANLPSIATVGEPLVTTDTNELYIGTGVGIKKVTDLFYGADAPSDVTKLWIDTTNNLMKRYDGGTSAWVALDAAQASVSFSDILGTPSDNTALATALAGKADTSSLTGLATTTSVTAAVAAEATARQSAINTAVSDLATTISVTAAVSAEATARNAAIATAVTGMATSSDITSAVSAEATARDLAITSAVSGLASTSYVDTKFTDLIGTAPTSLDTLQEIAAALQGDETTLGGLVTTVGTKASTSYVDTQLALKADASAIVTYTASKGVTLVGSDFELASSVAGTGLVYTDGVLALGTVDGGTF